MEFTSPLFGDESEEENEEVDGMHVIKSRKSDNQGDGLAKLMFNDPNHVEFLLNIREMNMKESSEKNEFHLYLEELINKGENLETKKMCRFCGEKVRTFSVYKDPTGIRVSPEYTSCGRESCKEFMLPGGANRSKIELYQFKFSALRQLQEKLCEDDFIKIKKLFRWAYGVSYNHDGVRLTNKIAYKLFQGELSD